jgi:anti-anti-sigma factor
MNPSRSQPTPLNLRVAGGGPGDPIVVVVAGRLDGRSVGQLRDELHRQLAHGHAEVLVDLADAEIGDATALALLVGTHHRARRGGQRVRVGAMSERTARLLRLAHLDRVLAHEASPASV